jgi:hypothetical protein
VKTMREYVIDEIEARIEAAGHNPVVTTEWANTGHIHAMEGIASVLQVDYAFHSGYCELTLAGLGVNACNLPDSPPWYRREGNRVRFYHLEYTDTDRLTLAMDLVSGALARYATVDQEVM